MIDLDEIERVARKGTPGKWQWDANDGSFGSLQDEGSHRVTVAYGRVEFDTALIDISEDDARHIAMCSPDVVLELIACLKAAEAARDEANREVIRLMHKLYDR